MIQRLISRFAELLIRRRASLLVVITLALLAIGSGAGRLVFDTSCRVWQKPDSPELQIFDRLTERFGSDDIVLIAFREPNGVLTNRSLAVVTRLTEALWKVPSVKRVDSLSNFSIARAGRLEHESGALAVNDAWIAPAGDQNDIHLWDRGKNSKKTLAGHTGLVEHLVLAEARLFSAAADGTVRAWDLDSGENHWTIPTSSASLSALALTPVRPYGWHCVIGSLAIFALSVVAHDGIHRAVHRDARINDACGWIASIAVGVPFHVLDESHRRHHANTGAPDDPELFCMNPSISLDSRRTIRADAERRARLSHRLHRDRS